MSDITAEELERIRLDWQAFAQKKVFAFRGITPAAYALYAPDYFRALMARSEVRVLRGQNEDLLAAIVFERLDEETFIVHWAWTHHEQRNQGYQYMLWEKCGISEESNVFITHLTVLSEKLAEKYSWLYSPFTLYKGTNDARSTKDSTHQPYANSGQPGTDAHQR